MLWILFQHVTFCLQAKNGESSLVVSLYLSEVQKAPPKIDRHQKSKMKPTTF